MPERDAASVLPGILAEVAELAGVAAALGLAEARGGTRLYVPASASSQERFRRTLGRALADALIDLRPGETVDIPRFAAGRKLAILRAKGSAAEIARRFKVTERYVYRLRNQDLEDGQLGLFEE